MEERLFKSTIKIVDSNLNMSDGVQVIYRVINFSNIYFFAQEISTGCIFPTYFFTAWNNKNSSNMRFRNNGYLKSGKYFLYYPLKSAEGIFEYTFMEKLTKGEFVMPNVKEVNQYLKEKEKDEKWKKKLLEMEMKNEYMCDLYLIKEKIAMLKSGDYTLNADFNKFKSENIKYTSSINLKKIEKFGYDLSTQEKLCNLIGREEEKKKITKAVAIRNDSVILIGEPGSGKTSIPESLALDIKNKRSPWLNDKIIFYLDTASLLGGTKYRGDFEERFLEFINFCKEHRQKIIIFIDEIHTIYGLGRSIDSAIDAMNILKPYISKGDIIIIGATTEKEYRKYMANDPAFLRRIEEVRVSVPDKNMNIEIILSYIKELQQKYSIKLELDENIIKEITDFIIDVTDPINQKVIGINKVINPTISKKIIDDAFAEAIYNRKELVTIDDICFAILSCDKFSPTYRKIVAEKLKKKIESSVKICNAEPIKLETKTLTLAK